MRSLDVFKVFLSLRRELSGTLALTKGEGSVKKRGVTNAIVVLARRGDSPSLHASRAVTWLTVYRALQVLPTGESKIGVNGLEK